MGGAQKKQGGKKNRKLGRDKVKCAAYRASRTREKRKIVKVARSNGLDQALAYAHDKGLTTFARDRLRRAGYEI